MPLPFGGEGARRRGSSKGVDASLLGRCLGPDRVGSIASVAHALGLGAAYCGGDGRSARRHVAGDRCASLSTGTDPTPGARWLVAPLHNNNRQFLILSLGTSAEDSIEHVDASASHAQLVVPRWGGGLSS